MKWPFFLFLSSSMSYGALPSTSINVSQGAIRLAITSLNSGSGSATNNSSTYTASATAGMGILKITGQIDQMMPAQSTLLATLATQSGISTGPTFLSTTAKNLVTTINAFTGFTDVNQTINLTFSISSGYAGGSSLTRTVTYTITN